MIGEGAADGLRALVATQRIDHHAAHSGYDLLAERVAGILPGASVVRSPRPPPWVPGRVWQHAARASGMPWYLTNEALMEYAVAEQIARGRIDVAHLLWGDQSYRWSGFARRRRGAGAAKLFVTFHQPPSVFGIVGPPRSALRQLDGIIALSQNQADFFGEIVGEERVFVVPHGVDTNYYVPGDEPRERDTCLVVGQWLRDHRTLDAAASLLAQVAPHIRIRLVGTRDPHNLARHPNVELLGRLSDEDLLRSYQTVGLVLMPLQDSTANCALLEALACGAPIVVTRVGGVPEYVGDGAVLVPHTDPRALASAVTSTSADEGRRGTLSVAARARALRLDWDVVAAEVVRAYRAA